MENKLSWWMGLVVCVVLAACTTEDKGRSFVQQRAYYNWDLPEQVFTESVHWDDQIKSHFSRAGCPLYLSEYIIKSSDIIDINHVFPYGKFDLTDDCIAQLVLFTHYYLQHHVVAEGRANYKLDLRDNPRLTNRSIAYLIELLKAYSFITRVDFRGNSLVSKDALAVLHREGKVQVLSD